MKNKRAGYKVSRVWPKTAPTHLWAKLAGKKQPQGKKKDEASVEDGGRQGLHGNKIKRGDGGFRRVVE